MNEWKRNEPVLLILIFLSRLLDAGAWWKGVVEEGSK